METLSQKDSLEVPRNVVLVEQVILESRVIAFTHGQD